MVTLGEKGEGGYDGRLWLTNCLIARAVTASE